MYKLAIFLALAGVAYAGAPVSYSTVTAPVSYAAPAVRAVAAAPVAYAQPAFRAAPVAYAQPAPVAYAQPVLRAAPVVAKAVAAEPFDPHPQYNYGYSVADSLTGDSHSATESRDGDVVKGQYSLVEPDGAIRTVTYTADAVNGFNAIVERTAGAPVVAKAVAAPVAVAQPVLRAAPVAYAQPAFRAAPVAYAQPAFRAAPVAYAQPAFRAAPVAYAQPAFRAAPVAVARAAPIAYAQPAFAKAVAAPVVSTTFGSPYSTYSY